MGRPNELNGQVEPNTLSGGADRRASGPPPAPPMAPRPSTTGGATLNGQRSAGRRPFSLWTLVVIAFIGFNLVRGFLAASNDTPDATTAPRASVIVAQPTRTADIAGTGTIEFGTGQGSDCTMSGTAESFQLGDGVYWYAHFTHLVAASARIEWSLDHAGAELESGDGPGDNPTEPWDGICGDQPLRYFEVGTYTVEVWTADRSEELATGTYTLVGAGTSGSP